MGFASKDILANLDKKYSSRNPQYLMDGKRMIDEAVAKAEVDGAFLEEYCNLKKKLELDNQVLVIAVAILTGLRRADGNGNPSVQQCTYGRHYRSIRRRCVGHPAG